MSSSLSGFVLIRVSRNDKIVIRFSIIIPFQGYGFISTRKHDRYNKTSLQETYYVDLITSIQRNLIIVKKLMQLRSRNGKLLSRYDAFVSKMYLNHILSH